MGDKLPGEMAAERGIMQIAFHLGAHMTDEDRLIRCLLRNREALAVEGIAIPGTAGYRSVLRRIAHEMRDRPTNAESQADLLEIFLEGEAAQRVVFSYELFLSNHRWAVAKNRLYPDAADKVRNLRRLFPEAQVSFYLAIRNPATFLPALVGDSRSGGHAQVMGSSEATALRWSDTVRRIREGAPDSELTVWCDEDTPLLWPEILRAVSGHGPEVRLAGAYDWYADFMSAEGLQRMTAWLDEHPPATDAQRRRILSAFLDKFALPEQVEVEAMLPDWDEATADVLSELYAQDIDLIATTPGITFLEP